MNPDLKASMSSIVRWYVPGNFAILLKKEVIFSIRNAWDLQHAIEAYAPSIVSASITASSAKKFASLLVMYLRLVRR